MRSSPPPVAFTVAAAPSLVASRIWSSSRAQRCSCIVRPVKRPRAAGGGVHDCFVNGRGQRRVLGRERCRSARGRNDGDALRADCRRGHRRCDRRGRGLSHDLRRARCRQRELLGRKRHGAARDRVVSGLSGVTNIDAQQYRTCAGKADGSVYCWGSLSSLGDGTTSARFVPTRVIGMP